MGREEVGVKRPTMACIAVVVLILPWPRAARGDAFVLSQGGRITGDLQNPEQSPRETYVVKTPDGSIVTLSRAQVKQVVRQRPIEIQYEKRRVHTAETAEAQWEMAEWCRENKLPAQRKVHLQRVIALDPEHGEARRALGYQRVDGKWLTQDEQMRKRGYLWYQGRYRTPEEIALLEEKRDLNAREKEWVRKVETYLAWLTGTRGDEARDKILSIDDPMAVRALSGALMRNQNPEVRVLLVQALARLGTVEAVRALAECSLEDPDDEVRLSCLDQLKKKKDPTVVEFYVGQLRSKSNAIVNRAALGLKEIGDRSAVGPLIDALITKHRTRAPSPPPGQMSATFGKGPGGGGTGLSAGAKAPKYIEGYIRNRVVLEALISLTGADYGFDVGAWKNWLAAQKTREPIGTRRD